MTCKRNAKTTNLVRCTKFSFNQLRAISFLITISILIHNLFKLSLIFIMNFWHCCFDGEREADLNFSRLMRNFRLNRSWDFFKIFFFSCACVQYWNSIPRSAKEPFFSSELIIWLINKFQKSNFIFGSRKSSISARLVQSK